MATLNINTKSISLPAVKVEQVQNKFKRVPRTILNKTLLATPKTTVVDSSAATVGKMYWS